MFTLSTSCRQPRARRTRRAHGLSLMEVLVATALIALLAVIAIPSYARYVERTRVAQAIRDMRAIEAAIRLFETDNRRLPATLAEASMALTDPWGRAYAYLDLTDVHARGSARKDRALNPINTDYDLYSLGNDGHSVSPLTAAPSLDDIVRGRNGQYVGLAKDF